MVSLELFAQAGQPNIGPEALGAFFCFLVVLLPIGLAIGALILRWASQIVSAPPPGFGKAMGIVLIVAIINFMIQFGLGFMVGLGLAVGQRPVDPESLKPMQAVVTLISIPLNALVSAGIYSATLEEVSFGKGLLIWLVELLIRIAIALVLVVGIAVFAIMAAALLHR